MLVNLQKKMIEWNGEAISKGYKVANFLNPLNPKIKIEILIYCPYTFSIEVVGRICWSIN